MANEPAVIATRDLAFSYNGHPVLEGVTFSVSANRFAAVVGPNGGGKTTLLRLILGLLRPDAGRVQVFGRPPQDVRDRVGYVPQHVNVDPAFPASVLDVVLTGRLYCTRRLGPYSRQDRRAARQALEEMEVGTLESAAFSELSGGQRQRVLIARSLASRPELLLLDEPTANLDTAIEAEFYGMLCGLSRRMTILVVSHDIGFVSQYVDTVICVRRRVSIHPTSELTGETIRELYGGDVRMVRHDHRCAEGGHQWPSS